MFVIYRLTQNALFFIVEIFYKKIFSVMFSHSLIKFEDSSLSLIIV